MVEGAAQLDETAGWLRRWFAARFGDVTRKEAWGYGVWFALGFVVAVPELWAAIHPASAPFPTISATVGYLEYHHVWVALIVTAVIVFWAYNALRYRPDRTGVLPAQGGDGGHEGDPALPNRTHGGLRLTRSLKPVRELSVGLYFGGATTVIVVATAIAAATSDFNDEFRVGKTLYGLIALFWVVLPALAAWPKKWALDIPFPTLVETVRSLERRLRVLALVVAAGLAILLVHLVLYPWPSTIPDIKDLHDHYKQGRTVPLAPSAPPKPTDP